MSKTRTFTNYDFLEEVVVKEKQKTGHFFCPYRRGGWFRDEILAGWYFGPTGVLFPPDFSSSFVENEIYVRDKDVIWEKPKVIMRFTSGREQVKYFKRYQDASNFAEYIMTINGWEEN